MALDDRVRRLAPGRRPRRSAARGARRRCCRAGCRARSGPGTRGAAARRRGGRAAVRAALEARDLRSGALLRQLGDDPGQRFDRRVLEQRAQGELDSEGQVQLGDEGGGEQRVAAEDEEVVVDAHLLDAERSPSTAARSRVRARCAEPCTGRRRSATGGSGWADRPGRCCAAESRPRSGPSWGCVPAAQARSSFPISARLVRGPGRRRPWALRERRRSDQRVGDARATPESVFDVRVSPAQELAGGPQLDGARRGTDRPYAGPQEAGARLRAGEGELAEGSRRTG